MAATIIASSAAADLSSVLASTSYARIPTRRAAQSSPTAASLCRFCPACVPVTGKATRPAYKLVRPRSTENSPLLRGFGVVCQASSSEQEPVKVVQPSITGAALEKAHLAASLAGFVAVNRTLKDTFHDLHITFPSSLVGMGAIFVILLGLQAAKPALRESVEAAVRPAVKFIQRWMPVFYVTPLVQLPLAAQGIPADVAGKMLLIVGVGWVISLLFTAWAAVTVRSITGTEMLPAEPSEPGTPFSTKELKLLGGIAAVSLILPLAFPTALGSLATTAAPFLVASTMFGLVMGNMMPASVKQYLHPILTCAFTAQAAVGLLALGTGDNFMRTLKLFNLAPGTGWAAGNILMEFLGPVVLSFAFSMFKQRKIMQRHAAEMFIAVPASALFSMITTAVAGHAMGLDTGITRALIPRCVTVALALPISSLLESGNLSITAAAVVLTGLVGANFAQTLLDKFNFKDPIARGLGTACSAHGLGTAALAAKEPDALPFCAVAYGLTGILSSLLVTVPFIRSMLLALAG
eukprot:jgi/Mesvir1/11880/Mv26096-RA.1